MLIRKFFKKKQTCVVNELIQEVNLMDTRKNNLKGEIVFGYCRGHNTILILFFILKDFMDNTYVYFQEIAIFNDNGLLLFICIKNKDNRPNS